CARVRAIWPANEDGSTTSRSAFDSLPHFHAWLSSPEPRRMRRRRCAVSSSETPTTAIVLPSALLSRLTAPALPLRRRFFSKLGKRPRDRARRPLFRKTARETANPVGRLAAVQPETNAAGASTRPVQERCRGQPAAA